MPLGLWLVGDRINKRQLLGGAVGVAGLALFFNPTLVDWTDGRALLGNGLLILGAMSWALGACLYRRRAWGSGLWTQTSWQLIVSTLPLGLFACLSLSRPIEWNTELLLIFSFNWVIATALAYWCWAKVLRRMTVAAAGQTLMLTPIFGYLLSCVSFGDQLTSIVWVSLALIVLGLMLTIRPSTPLARTR